MESSVEEAIIAALDALEAGDNVDDIVARYPDHEAELRPILSTAASLASVRIAHSLKAQAASQQRMLEYAASSGAAVSRGPSVLLLLRRLSLAMASLVIVLALLGMSVLYAASESVPGDRLYDAKRLMEDTRLSLTGSTAAREALQQRYEEERIREIETLLRMERSEEVEFAGFIEAIDGDVWTVSGLEVLIVSATSIEGAESPVVGQLVEVSGVAVNGSVSAKAVMIRGTGGLLVPTPRPVLSVTPTYEPTPPGTPTPTPTDTPTATPTPTVGETGSGELATSTPTPTTTPTPESNENSNANEGSNENEAGPNSNENEGESSADQDGSENSGNANRNENNENEDDENEDKENNKNEDDERGGNGKDNEEKNENKDNENRNDDD